MRWIFTLCLFTLFTPTTKSQNLTGIWRGYFVQKSFNQITGRFIEDKYKYEIQIHQLSNSSLEGVTYSYKTTVFYGKASFHGIYTKATKNVLIKELKMLDLKISDMSVPCLMTCYLDYAKSGKLEMLSGTFTSINTEQKTDCGDGSLYLEKVPESDFEKESFLLKKDDKKPAAKPKPEQAVSHDDITNIKSLQLALKVTADGILGPLTLSALKTQVPGFTEKLDVNNTDQIKRLVAEINSLHKKNPVQPERNSLQKSRSKNVAPLQKNQIAVINKPKPAIKPGAEDFVVKKKETIKPIIIDSATTGTNKKKKEEIVIEKKPQIKAAPVPKLLLDRENKLVNTLDVDVKEVRIDFYDNGQIDNDTITVYDNNELAIDHGRLSYAPITLNLRLNTDYPTHEIITVANNLGDVPPNTALMVVTAGKKRYEIFITSDENRNAKVIIQYKPHSEIQVH